MTLDDFSGASAPTPTDRALRLPAVLDKCGLGRTAILDRVKRGEFPAPFRVGRATLWSESAVSTWLAEQARRGATGSQR